MGKVDSTNSEQLDFNRLGEAYFDCASVLAQSGSFKYALRGQGKPYKTFIVETAPDRNGNSNGYVDVYLGSAINGSPWRTIAIGGGRSGPVPAVDFVTLVPRAGSVGTVNITLSTEIWGSYFRKPATATYFPLEDLTDVQVSSPVAGQVLEYNGADWINATPSGGSSAFDAAALAIPTLTHYWKCNDAVGSTALLDSVGIANLTVTGGATTGGRVLCRDGEPGLQTFGGATDGASTSLSLILPSTGNPFTLFMVCQVLVNVWAGSGSTNQIYGILTDASATFGAWYDCRSPGATGGQSPLLYGIGSGGANQGLGLSPGSLSTFLLWVTDNGSNSQKWYWNGYNAMTFNQTAPRSGALYIGNMNQHFSAGFGGACGTFAKIGVASSVLSLAQMAALLAAM